MIRCKPLLIAVYLEDLKSLEFRLSQTLPADAEILEDTNTHIEDRLEAVEEVFVRPLKMGKELSRHIIALQARLRGEHVLTSRDNSRSNSTIRHELRFLIQEIEQALRERLFPFMPQDDALFYDQPELFGAKIARKFPKANKEITTAGTCYAIQSYTACVFHLTRVVETCAVLMVTRLGVAKEIKGYKGTVVPVRLATWEQLRQALSQGIERKKAGIGTSVAKKETFEFYNHAVSQFAFFKDAWRNKIAHNRKTYLAGETKDIMDNVKSFMLHLSQRLSESS